MSLVTNTKQYLDELKKRAGTSHVYQKHQLDGLEIADILDDRAHKALYMKLAKTNDSSMLREIAKGVAEQKDVKNRGAYFMAILGREGRLTKAKPVKRPKKK